MSVMMTLNAQSINKQVIASLGNSISNSNYQITNTVGEAVIGPKMNAVTINQGFLASITNTATLSTTTLVTDQNIKVYPNPVIETLNIDLGGTTKATLTIYDVTGKEIFREILGSSKSSFNMADFSKGVYLVQLYFKENQINETFKILKQ